MKPFIIENGKLKINVADLHTFLEQFNLKFSSVSDISVMPIGVIVQCEATGPLTDGNLEQLITWCEDLEVSDAGKDDPLYPVEHCFFSENEVKLTVVPFGGAANYQHNYELVNVPEHFAAGGEVAPGITYVMFDGKKVHLFDDEAMPDPLKAEVAGIINRQIASWVDVHVEKMNSKLFDKSYAYNLVVNRIKEATEQFNNPFVVSENSINEIIEQTFE